MNQENIDGQLMEILKKYTRNPAVWETANDDSDLIKDLKINSARFVDVILDLEDTFEIEIDDAEMDNIITIGNAKETIHKLIGK